MIKNKIILLSTRNFSKIDFVRAEFKKYLKSKVKIEIWYLCKLFNNNSKINNFKPKNVKIKKIDNYFQIENLIKKNY